VRPALALALLIALAGCARDSQKQPANSRSGPPAQGRQQQPQPRDPANEPYGRLSPAEKRAIVREYRLLQPLQNGDDSPEALARGQRVCAALTAPQTTLVARVRADCQNAIKFFASLRALEAVGTDCDSRKEYPTCEQARFSAMADALRATSSGAAAINAELRQRGITGLCARSIGITQPQLDAYRRAEQAARGGADALAAGNAIGYANATRALSKALSEGGGGDPLSGIVRGCRTAKSKPLPTLPSTGGINA
jgi:hypothetical protein